ALGVLGAPAEHEKIGMGQRGDLLAHTLARFVAGGGQDGRSHLKGKSGFANPLRAVQHDGAGQAALLDLLENGRTRHIMANGRLTRFWQRQALQRRWITHALASTPSSGKRSVTTCQMASARASSG